MAADYQITDGDGNSVIISDSEVGTEVDTSALTDGSLTVTVTLENTTIDRVGRLTDFAVYFD